MAISFGIKTLLNGLTLGASAPILDVIDVSQRIKDKKKADAEKKAKDEADAYAKAADAHKKSVIDDLLGNTAPPVTTGSGEVVQAANTGISNTDIGVIIILATLALLAILFMHKKAA